MSEPRSFAQKAALFSLVAPILAGAISVGTQSLSKNWSPLEHRLQAILYLVLLLGGLVASVIALASIPRRGKSGILWPALGGLVLNCLVLGFVGWIFLLVSRGGIPSPGDLANKRQIAGAWVKEENGGTMTIELRPEGSFRFVLTGKSIADFSGKWDVRNRRLILNVETIVTGKAAIGEKIQWSIDKLDQNELVLGASNGQDRFQRRPVAE